MNISPSYSPIKGLIRIAGWLLLDLLKLALVVGVPCAIVTWIYLLTTH